ncbi:glycosyltransferase family 1 protein [Empedobacter sp. GD03739]|uniref:glycosyltransferase family 4 protein n=1 Tax=Empedobacter sp. GD03739 TaxID=2975376 RepID=UPI0024488771|nr:glycosyltransferase family 1 protein [Empedobacter sp. GD03739]MDH1603121.1 glycosyltransferase family 4 protein [Empedobacter sp. GD03739]
MAKKILLESHNLKNRATGFGVFNYELIKALSKLNFDDQIYLLYKKPEDLRTEFGTKFHYKKYYSLMRNPFFRTREKYDVWHSLNQNIKVEPCHKPKKYVLTIHDVNFMEENSLDYSPNHIKYFKEKIKRVDVITFISEYAKKQTMQYFDISGIENTIIYNGNSISEIINCDDFQSPLDISKPYFYTIGAFLEKKNFESLVKMMKFLPDFNLIISGNCTNAYGQKIKDLIAKEKLENQVFLSGKVSERAKQFYMQNCEAFLFPSTGEGFGLPPLEAMSFGKPIILSDKTSLPEIGGKDAFYWNDFEPEYMKNVVEDALNQYNQNSDYFIESYIKRAASFSWDKAANEYLKVYEI